MILSRTEILKPKNDNKQLLKSMFIFISYKYLVLRANIGKFIGTTDLTAVPQSRR